MFMISFCTYLSNLCISYHWRSPFGCP